ncbi:MAG: response regulator [Deltaproteobacteria bacterium]|nr:response regulator [Deltaproteobacteria bacterium]
MSKDPKRYFRIEARDLLDSLSRDLMGVERGERAPDAVARLFRNAHTIKGAAMVVGEEPVAEIARLLEDVLGEHRDAGTELSQREARELLRVVESLDLELKRIEAEPRGDDAGKKALSPDAGQAIETVRIDLAEMDALTHPLAAAEMQALGMASTIAELDVILQDARSLPSIPGSDAIDSGIPAQLLRLRHAMRSRLDALVAELRSAREHAEGLRLVPADAILPVLERTASMGAAAVGKTVRVELQGGEVRVDRGVLPSVREALLHLVRNAVDHGIEAPEVRRRAGKPAEGVIRLSVSRRGSRVAFTCDDDGCGIDAVVVRETSVRLGLITEQEAESLDAAATLRLLFRQGMSTRDGVTDLSGRGVGLDVVRSIASRLRGDVRLETRLGAGTTVELVTPVSLSTTLAVEVIDQDAVVLVPLDAVIAVRTIRESDLARSSEGRQLIHDGEALRYARVGALVGLRGSALQEATTALVVRHDDGRLAIGAERLGGIREILVRPLPWAAGAAGAVLGASIDCDGVPRLVLDPGGLDGQIQKLAKSGAEAPVRVQEKRRPLLVVDDSLTTRMLEQSILETAGYEVDVATSGEEALRMARSKQYALFVVDVEMPGMSGFDFTVLTRNDAALKEVPVVLVTSLSGEADEKRGLEAGAAAYVVKGKFHQGRFLGLVADLAR